MNLWSHYQLFTLFLGVAFSSLIAEGQLLFSEERAQKAEGEEHVAIVVSSRGESKLVRFSGEKVPAKIGTPLFLGDRVVTERNSTVKIFFRDQATFSLAGDTDLTIDDYLFGKGKEVKSVISISNGTFRFMAGKIAKIAPEKFKIRTSTASIGIRGSGGEGRTSDGTKGRAAGLEIVTIAGHVLDITTSAGEKFVVDDPSQGVRVNALGKGEFFSVGELFFIDENQVEQVAQFPIPIPKQYPQLPNREHSSLSLQIWRRRKLFIVHKRKFVRLESEQLIREALKAIVGTPKIELDLELRSESCGTVIGIESSSSVPIMLQLSQEIVRKKASVPKKSQPMLNFTVKRERGTAHSILQNLSKEVVDQRQNEEVVVDADQSKES